MANNDEEEGIDRKIGNRAGGPSSMVSCVCLVDRCARVDRLLLIDWKWSVCNILHSTATPSLGEKKLPVARLSASRRRTYEDTDKLAGRLVSYFTLKCNQAHNERAPPIIRPLTARLSNLHAVAS